MSTCCRSIFFSSSARALSLITPPLDWSFCWSAWSALFRSPRSATFFWLSACTFVVATLPSADSLAIRWMLMKANFVPSGNFATGGGAGAGCAAAGAGGVAGLGAGCAGAWANVGAVISIAPSTATPVKALISVVVLSFLSLECRSHREAEHQLLGRPQIVVQHALALRVFSKNQAERHVEDRHEEPDLGTR